MKKVTVFISCMILAFATSGFAAGNGTWTDADATTPDTKITCGATETMDVSLSPRVEAIYFGGNTTYTIATRNIQGSRTFGANSSDAGIYYAEGIDASVTSGTQFASEWESL